MLLPRDSGRYNAYYFHNVKTKETTWTNPIVGTPKAAPKKDARQVLQGVDPDLAYLDPNLSVALSSSASSGGTVAGGAYAAAGRFNARTGKFEGDPSRNPDFVSDFSRMKRQSNIYFDVDGWEKVRRWWSRPFGQHSMVRTVPTCGARSHQGKSGNGQEAKADKAGAGSFSALFPVITHIFRRSTTKRKRSRRRRSSSKIGTTRTSSLAS
jgi:hypothetical protein